MIKKIKLTLAASLMLVRMSGICGIVYDKKSNTIKISDCPSDMPCTPAGLYSLDQTQDWGKVAYDEKTDTYTVSCNLQIGDNDGTETFFQVGSTDNPKETLVMRGNIYLAPFWVKGENTGLYYRVPVLHNRLTLGVEGNKEITPALKFSPVSVKNKTGIYSGTKIGVDGKNKSGVGGELFTFNATVGSAGYKYYRNTLGMVKLVNTTFSGSINELVYGLANFKRNSVIDGCTFKDSRYGAGVNATLTLRNCVFENLSVCAVSDPGGINAKLINCVFKNNQQNFRLQITAKGVTLVDCEVAPGKVPDTITSRKFRGTMRFPKLVSTRHIVVKVVDSTGKPVAGAEVSAIPEQKSAEAAPAKAKTDSNGLTPGNDAKKTLLLAEYCKQAVEGSDTPKETTFSYKVTVSKAGKTAVISGVKADKSWQQIEVTLK